MEWNPVLIRPRLAAMKTRGLWADKTINDYLDECLASVPDKEAVVDFNSMTGQETRLTYRELARRVESVSAALVRLGVAPGEVVSFQLPNWWQFSALYMACARIGAVANPLMPIFRQRELSFMLDLAETKVLIAPRLFRGFDHGAMAMELRQRVKSLEHVLVIGGDGETSFESILLGGANGPEAALRPPQPPLQADDVTQLLYTSGTTGEPKGVMHTSNTLISNIVPYADRLGLSAADTILMASPLAHQTGFMYGLMMPVILKATAVLQDVWDPARAMAAIDRERVTFTMASTPFLNDLTEYAAREGRTPQTLRVFLSAGAPIPRPLVAKAGNSLGAVIISAWGMTENGAVTTTRLDDPEEKAFNTDGCPLQGMEVRTVDVSGKPVAPGQEGRLMARGCSQFAGYLKRAEWNNTDPDGWFDTGDLARMSEDGYIRISGRTKDVIIRGGENIPVAEIEGLLFKHPAVASVAIVGYPDARLGERAAAFVTVRDGATFTFDDMVAFLVEQQTAKSYMPERLEIIEEQPRTPSGKIQKFKLREMAAAFGQAPSR